MDFMHAMEWARRVGITRADLARALGVDPVTARRWRDKPGEHFYRPPAGWRAALAELARERGDACRELAEALEEAP